jgi:hypothetical protein
MSPSFAALPIMPEQQLIDAANLLQNEFASLWGSEQLPPALLANQLKQSLLQQVSKLTGGQKQRINAADEDAIDLVGMLFDFVLGDRNLPAQVQAILARLQVPYLKVALLDRHLFSQRHHPARRLLDEMAQACVGWTDEGDRDGRMLGKVRELVENLLANFESDLGIFERLHEDFIGFLGQQRKRSEIAEQRTAETALGRERLEAARIAATKAVHARTARRALPEVVREIITGPWSKLLEVTHARKGSESTDWVGALKFMDDLLWSVDIRQIAADETRWHQLKPEVETTLQQGLQLVGYHSEDVHRWFRACARNTATSRPARCRSPMRPSSTPGPSTRRQARRRGRARDHGRRAVDAVGRADPRRGRERGRRGHGHGRERAPDGGAPAQGRHLDRVRGSQGRQDPRQAVLGQPDQREVPVREPERGEDRGEVDLRLRGRRQGRARDRAPAGAAVRPRPRRDHATAAFPDHGPSRGYARQAAGAGAPAEARVVPISYRRPVSARAITRRWISLVPS